MGDDVINFRWMHNEFGCSREINREDLDSELSVVLRNGGREMWFFVDNHFLPPPPQEMSDADALSMLVEGCSQASQINITPQLGGPGVSNPDNIGDILDIEQFRSELIDDFGAGDGRVKEFTTLAKKFDGNHLTIHERGIVINSGPFVFTTEIPELVDLLKEETQSLCRRPLLRHTHIQNGEESTIDCFQLSPVNGDIYFALLLRMFADGCADWFNNNTFEPDLYV